MYAYFLPMVTLCPMRSALMKWDQLCRTIDYKFSSSYDHTHSTIRLRTNNTLRMVLEKLLHLKYRGWGDTILCVHRSGALGWHGYEQRSLNELYLECVMFTAWKEACQVIWGHWDSAEYLIFRYHCWLSMEFQEDSPDCFPFRKIVSIDEDILIMEEFSIRFLL